MITGLFYDILIIMPAVLAVSSLLPFGPGPARGGIAAASVLYIMVMKHVKLRERVLIAGITAIVLLAAFLYLPEGGRMETLTENAWIGKTASASAAAAFICLLSKRSMRIRAGIAALGLAALIYFLISGRAVGRDFVVPVFAYVLITLCDIMQMLSDKEGDTRPERHLVSISPFVIAVIIAVSFISVPDRPYGWGFVKTISEAVKSTAARISDSLSGNGWDSDAPFIGFSDRAGFRGSLTGAGYKVMDVLSAKESEPYLYLAGKVYDRFDGHGWEPAEDDVGARDFDTIETAAAVMRASQEEKQDQKAAAGTEISAEPETSAGAVDNRDVYQIPKELAAADSLTIEQDIMKGDFLPAKCIPGSLKEGRRAEVSYFRLNTGLEDFVRILNSPETMDPDSWNGAVSALGADAGKYSYEGFLNCREKIYDEYLPETDISEKLKAFMDEELSGAKTDYEKLLRIESLLGSYTYSERPGALPESVTGASDYLDYLIFDKKEGYCSHFATAFVLLARAYGIPARYVQGYRIETQGARHIEVLSTYAHAWPEAYIDGVGFIAFEPTPGMKGIFSARAWTARTGEGLNGKDHSPKADPEGADAMEAADEAKKIGWGRFAVPAAVAAAFTLLIFVADFVLKKRRYKRLDDRGKAEWLCRRCMALLSRRGLRRDASETLCEYRDRTEGMVPAGTLDFCGIYEKMLYSDNPVTEDDRKNLEDNFERIRKMPRNPHIHIANK
ncbi:MAG: DUF3488 and transglutaminase-like domain-containing protein [Lachnospiraceae bacterium]|nr:DUF3488 and transglutaminase-like domain-containing protein [Lachnospiraceae bacterium]